MIELTDDEKKAYLLIEEKFEEQDFYWNKLQSLNAEEGEFQGYHSFYVKS